MALAMLCASSVVSVVTQPGRGLQLPTSPPVRAPHLAEISASPFGPDLVAGRTHAPFRTLNDVLKESMPAWHLLASWTTSLAILLRAFPMLSRHFVLALSAARSAPPTTANELPPAVSRIAGSTAPFGSSAS